MVYTKKKFDEKFNDFILKKSVAGDTPAAEIMGS